MRSTKHTFAACAIALLLLTFQFRMAQARTAARPQAQYVCLIVLDAGRPDYIADNLSQLPHLRALLRNGRWYDRAWVGDLMSMTPVSHAVIGTGSLPRDDGGIVNWNWTVKSTGEVTPSLQALESYQNGYAFRLIQGSGAPTIASVIRRRFPHALVIAGAGQHFHAAGAMGGPYANWIFAYQRINGYWAPFSLGAHRVPARLLNDRSLRRRLVSNNDSTIPLVYQPLPLGEPSDLVLSFAARAVSLYRPRALLLNVAGPDTIGHFSLHWRSDETRFYRTFDRELEVLLSAYRRAGIFNRTLFVITSDHGMVRTTTRFLDRNRVQSILASAGAQPVLFNGAGTDTMMSIWLRNPDSAERAARALYAAHLDNVSAIFYLRQTAGGYRYVMTGCEVCPPRLAAAYRYLLSTEAGPTGEDIAILLRENSRVSGDPPVMIGAHGGADWDSQHVTLLFSGPGAADRSCPNRRAISWNHTRCARRHRSGRRLHQPRARRRCETGAF